MASPSHRRAQSRSSALRPKPPGWPRSASGSV